MSGAHRLAVAQRAMAAGRRVLGDVRLHQGGAREHIHI